MDEGEVLINGFDIKHDFVKAIERVGAIVEAPDVYLYLTGYENLKMQASYYKNIKEEDITRVIELVGLEKRIHDKVSKYSLGMRQRLGIAAALINNPRLLILDEPTNGLDPEGIKNLRELLHKLANTGIGVLISSHNLSELESFCNKVCIISKGEVISLKTINEIKEIDGAKYIIKVNKTKGIGKLLNTTDKIVDDNHIAVIKDEEEVASFIKELVLKNIKIYEVKKEEYTLEEAFINVAGGKKID